MQNLTLQKISKYRTALMGIATLMIIISHAPASGVIMPHIWERIMGLGNFGVDIFLFLSGIGGYYSLSKMPKKSDYFKKRYLRLGIPYFLITTPFIITYLLMGVYSIPDALLSFTTFDFWLEHKGAWFIAMLIPLYLLSPVFFNLLSGKKKWWMLIILSGCIVVLCNIPTENSVLSNIQFAFQRVPSYLVGMAIGEYCKSPGPSTPNNLIIKMFVFGGGGYLLCHYLWPKIFFLWILVPIVVIILTKFKIRKLINLPMWEYTKNVYIPIITMVVIAIILPIFVHLQLEEGWTRFLAVGFTCVVSVGLSTFLIGLTKSERNFCIDKGFQILKIKG